MKAIFPFCKPGPTSDNFASMTVSNFEGLSQLKDFALMAGVKFEA